MRPYQTDPIRQTLSDKLHQTHPTRQTLPDKPCQADPSDRAYQTDPSDRPYRCLDTDAVPCQEKGLVATVYSLTFYYIQREGGQAASMFAWCLRVCVCVCGVLVCVEALITRRVQSSGLE